MVAYSGEAKPVKQGAETGRVAEVGGGDWQRGARRGWRCRTSTQFDVRRCGQDGAEVRGRTVGGRTRARAGNRRASARRATAVGQRGGATTRESGRPLGGVADSRPELPWTFGVIDTPEVNAFAAPGGFVLVTRGMYEIVASDAELSAVLAHEINHCVQRDHYNVIRKQELASAGKDLAMREVTLTGDAAAIATAKRYADEYGARHRADFARSRCRIQSRRSRADIRRARRDESVGVVLRIPEDGRSRRWVASLARAVSRRIRRWTLGWTRSTSAATVRSPFTRRASERGFEWLVPIARSC